LGGKGRRKLREELSEEEVKEQPIGRGGGGAEEEMDS
jgi:hypothetical protein